MSDRWAFIIVTALEIGALILWYRAEATCRRLRVKNEFLTAELAKSYTRQGSRFVRRAQ